MNAIKPLCVSYIEFYLLLLRSPDSSSCSSREPSPCARAPSGIHPAPIIRRQSTTEEILIARGFRRQSTTEEMIRCRNFRRQSSQSDDTVCPSSRFAAIKSMNKF
ncbi:hypothetical protein P5V15_000255 [Pogonomyrmex californicus]